ncbi:MAG: hypothetical protein ABMA13_01615 [Chthoniobacteraceae bacterium]
MKTKLPTSGNSGQAMIVALILLAVVTALSGVVIQRTSASARSSARASDFSDTERTSDGLIEYAYGAWKAATLAKGSALGATFNVNGTATALALSELTNLTPTGAIPSGFSTVSPSDADGDGTWKITLVDHMGVPVTTPPSRLLVALADYPGWRGFAYNYLASVRLRDNTNISNSATTRPVSGARRLFQYIEVPLFQSMYFFEHDLEIYRPAPMIVGGLVHSNSRLLLSGSGDKSGVELNFQGNVSFAGGTTSISGYTATEPPIGGLAWSGTTAADMEPPTFSNGGQSSQLSKVTRYEPLGNKPAAVLDAAPTSPISSSGQLLGPDGDSDGNLNNDSYRELIEPPVSAHADPPEIAKRRLYNKAGIVVSVNGSTITTSGSSPNYNTVVTVTAKNGTTLSSAQITNIKLALSKNSFYDEREAKMVDVVNVDMAKVKTEVDAAVGFNGVLYVQDITPTASGDTEPKAIRLKKGGSLPTNGLTVASQNPVYIHGDYNTGTTYTTSGTPNSTSVPANSTGNPNNTDSPTVNGYTRKPSAVIADAVMFLSNAWNDSNASSSSSSLSNRVASNTTINTAIMSGFVPSGWDPDGSGGVAAYGYSGGANNFPRFLEAWSGKACTYYGSMVELFQSKVFTGKWNTGDIYSAPNRRWNYDTVFSTTPPPGSVDAVVIVRGTWARL